tara:strand:+ start:45 stop:353 length:309 start_codon:yes stop_codon:yes gene_type:complete
MSLKEEKRALANAAYDVKAVNSKNMYLQSLKHLKASGTIEELRRIKAIITKKGLDKKRFKRLFKQYSMNPQQSNQERNNARKKGAILRAEALAKNLSRYLKF